jgi:hypothetical protein
MKCSAQRSVFACLLVTLSVSVIGCTSSFQVPDSAAPTDPLNNGTADLRGSVHGGRQPIVGAQIFLYAAPTTGYEAAGSLVAPISLLGNNGSQNSPTTNLSNVGSNSTVPGAYYVKTDAAGNFNLSGDYTCTPGQEVWVYSIGGDPGQGPVSGGYGQNSPVNIFGSLTGSLGTCPSAGNFAGVYNYLYVNEVSTAAFGYAVAPFAYDAQHISSGPSAQAILGLTNAFANAALLYDISGKASVGYTVQYSATQAFTATGVSGTLPYKLVNAMANSLANCINSTQLNNGTSPSLICSNLFTDSETPTQDTASAAIAAAQHPANADVLTVAGTFAPWGPIPTNVSKVTDLTAAISWTKIDEATGIQIDGSGNAVTTYTNPSTGASAFNDISPVGVPTRSNNASTTDPLDVPVIDSHGNLWSAGQDTGDLYENKAGGAKITTYLQSVTTLSAGKHNMAADNKGYIYVVDTDNNEIVQTNPSTGGPYNELVPNGNNTCAQSPLAVAIDPNLDVWSVGQNGNDICRFVPPATAGGVYNQLFQTPISNAISLALDSSNDAWVVTTGNPGGLYEVSPTGTLTGPFTSNGGGGLEDPQFIAIDGANNVWVVNTDALATPVTPSISEFNHAGAPLSPGTSGYQLGNTSLSNPTGIAIDPSGDVWVPNYGSSTVIELIGAAAPTSTPLSLLTPGTKP